MSTITEIKVPEPLVSVHSRVSWGALLAGSVVAIAVYSLLTMLGIAVGFSVSDRLGTGAAVWSFVTLLLAMFVGGWVATRCTAGELRSEAVLYGIIVWGITSTLLIPLTAAGVGLGSGTALAERGLTSLKNSSIPPMLNGAVSQATGSRVGCRTESRKQSPATIRATATIVHPALPANAAAAIRRKRPRTAAIDPPDRPPIPTRSNPAIPIEIRPIVAPIVMIAATVTENRIGCNPARVSAII